MEINEVINFLIVKINHYLQKFFTGKIIITLHCKEGGIGNVSFHVKEHFDSKSPDLPSD